MTHEERRIRRQQMAAMAGEKSISEVATHFGVTLSTVKNACLEFSSKFKTARRSAGTIRKAARVTGILDAVQAGQNIYQVATSYGVSDATVRRILASRGIKANRISHQLTTKDILGIVAAVLNAEPNAAIARKFGVSDQRVGYLVGQMREVGLL